MALRSGMLAAGGIVEESSYGVPVTTSMVWNELVSESLGNEITMLESAGIISGRRTMTTDQRALGGTKVGGDVGLELTNKDLRKWFKQMFGGESGSGPYTYTPGDLTGTSFTYQVQRPGAEGTVHPFTYSGCKVASWEIGIKEGEISTLGVTIIAQKEIGYRQVTDGVTTNTSTSITSATAAFGPDDVGKPISGTGISAGTTISAVTSTTAATLSAAATATGTGITFTIGLAAASASYSSAILPWHYDQATLTIAGTAVKVKEATLSGDNALDDGRRFLGQRWIEEPLEAGLRKYSGSITPEFTDRTQYQRYVNGLDAALVVTLSNGTDSITITENVRFDGTTPKVDGPKIIEQPLPFVALATSAGADSTAITAVLSQA